MTDIALRNIEGMLDLLVSGDDLLADEGLESACALSLYCERLADESDILPDGETDRRGWWGDQFSPTPNDTTGSKLWMLWRAPRTQATLQAARRYCEQSLQWLVDDGVAARIAVETSFDSIANLAHSSDTTDYALVIAVAVTKPDGTTENFRFAYQWQQQAEKH